MALNPLPWPVEDSRRGERRREGVRREERRKKGGGGERRREEERGEEWRTAKYRTMRCTIRWIKNKRTGCYVIEYSRVE